MTHQTGLTLVKPTLQTLQLATVEPAVLSALRVICRDANGAPATNEEIAVFAQYCTKRGLDPFGKQIYFIKDRHGKIYYQIAIDGLWGLAHATGELTGRVGPYWMGRDREWIDYWVEDYAPLACRVGILRKGWNEPCWGFARFGSFAGKIETYTPWGKMPEHMLAKVASSIALRVAFPQQCGGLYIPEESLSGPVEIPGGPVLAEFYEEPTPEPGPTKPTYKHIDTGSPEPVPPTRTRTKKESDRVATGGDPGTKKAPPKPVEQEPQEPTGGETQTTPEPAPEPSPEPAEQDWEADPEDAKTATIDAINETWGLFRARYGQPNEGQTAAEGKANATRKFEELFPSIKSMRTATKGQIKQIMSHLNGTDGVPF